MNIEEIKKALEAATPEWYDNGNEIVSKRNLRVGIGGFLTEKDNYLAANAPTWLSQLLQEREQMVEALKKVRSSMYNEDFQSAEDIAFTTLKQVGELDD